MEWFGRMMDEHPVAVGVGCSVIIAGSMVFKWVMWGLV